MSHESTSVVLVTELFAMLTVIPRSSGRASASRR